MQEEMSNFYKNSGLGTSTVAQLVKLLPLVVAPHMGTSFESLVLLFQSHCLLTCLGKQKMAQVLGFLHSCWRLRGRFWLLQSLGE